MPGRLVRYSLASAFLWWSQAFALGLGDIRVDSALNEPLRAEIELLAASPDALANLKITLAPEATFAHYDLDRPSFLGELTFQVISTGRAEGNVIRLTSLSPITEPFVIFLIEATWPSGRLLREYTVLLDPPTFTAPSPRPAVAPPVRTPPADSAPIERQATRPPPERAPVSDTSFSPAAGEAVVVQPGDTLWGLALQMRPDSRLTINQTMLAIFAANPDAFGGNMNLLKAGARLRMPSADQIVAVDRGAAQREAAQQHAAWDSSDTRTSLTLVPADEEPTARGDAGMADTADETPPLTREQAILDRIAKIEADAVPSEPSLIEIRNNELATLRNELANIRGDVYEPPVAAMTEQPASGGGVEEAVTAAEPESEGERFPDPDVSAAANDRTVAEDTSTPAPRRAQPEPSLGERLIGWASGVYAMIAYAVLAVLLVLAWSVRRNRSDGDAEAWRSLAADDPDTTMTGDSAARLSVPEGGLVVEEQQAQIAESEDTTESPALAAEDGASGSFDSLEDSLEDTFSSNTAVNLDQSDPLAEADFHMAYGLYDQAADLINGALEVEPERQDLLSKLCEVYFVWGNRDAFVDAASRLKGAIGSDESAEWDKIVIMGQQIAADNALFAGAGTTAATRVMDLDLDTEDDGAPSALDVELSDMESGDDDAGDTDAGDEVVDLGTQAQAAGDDLDFDFAGEADAGSEEAAGALDLEFTTELPTGGTSDASADTEKTREMPSRDDAAGALDLEFTTELPTGGTSDASVDTEKTREMPSRDDAAESPASEPPPVADDTESTSELPAPADTDGAEQSLDVAEIADMESTSELPALTDTDGAEQSLDVAETAEIDLDDLGLDIDSLAETGLVSLDEDLETATPEQAQADTVDDSAATGHKDPEEDEDPLSRTSTGMYFAADETGISPAVDMLKEDKELDGDADLSAASGNNPLLSDDSVVQTGSDLGDDDATMLAPALGDRSIGDDDDGDVNLAPTEARPPDAFGGGADTDDSTSELPVTVATDSDDLANGLGSGAIGQTIGDTVDMPRDEGTLEQPLPGLADADADAASTMTFGPDDMSDELDEARTMKTEVGTKLDLARAYVDMGDPAGARSILEEVLDEGDEAQRQQAQSLLDTLSA